MGGPGGLQVVVVSVQGSTRINQTWHHGPPIAGPQCTGPAGLGAGRPGGGLPYAAPVVTSLECVTWCSTASLS